MERDRVREREGERERGRNKEDGRRGERESRNSMVMPPDKT